MILLVQFLATKEALTPLANVPIMSERSIQLIRHLEHHYPSIISGDIGRARSVQQFRNGGTERRNGMEEQNGIQLIVRVF